MSLNHESSPTWNYGPRNVRDRYMQDAVFHHLVDMLRNELEMAHLTPTEIREAAMLAQILYEERCPRPIIFTRDDVIKGKV